MFFAIDENQEDTREPRPFCVNVRHAGRHPSRFCDSAPSREITLRVFVPSCENLSMPH